MVKVGIIGTGFIGDTHAEAYKRIENAELVGVVNRGEEKGKEFAKKFECKFYKTIDELLEADEVDAIDVCVPSYLHKDIVKKAANAGKNILCEKPVALSLDDADEMIDAIKKNNVKAMVAHVLRFWPGYVKAKEIIDSKEFGAPLYALCERLLAITPGWRGEDHWAYKEELSGGVPMDVQIHDIDYLIWLFGMPKSVKSQGLFNKKLGGWAHMGSLFEFKDKVSGFAEAGWAFRGAFPFTMILRIACENGSIEWMFRAGESFKGSDQEYSLKVFKPDGEIYIPEVENEDPFYLQLKYFIDSIDRDEEIKNATFEDARNTLLTTLAVMESAKENKVIKL